MTGLQSPGADRALDLLVGEVRACRICAEHLPHGCRPVLQVHSGARILIAGQAPGRKVHERGIPFDDASGDRLRQWMGVDRDTFYDAETIAILPMGFCYPGRGRSGDLPPRAECAAAWRDRLLAHLPRVELTMLIGQHAQNWHLGERRKSTLTETALAWRDHWPRVVPLPHPSPRNNIWLKRNAWFECDLLPRLQARVHDIVKSGQPGRGGLDAVAEGRRLPPRFTAPR